MYLCWVFVYILYIYTKCFMSNNNNNNTTSTATSKDHNFFFFSFSWLCVFQQINPWNHNKQQIESSGQTHKNPNPQHYFWSVTLCYLQRYSVSPFEDRTDYVLIQNSMIITVFNVKEAESEHFYHTFWFRNGIPQTQKFNKQR